MQERAVEGLLEWMCDNYQWLTGTAIGIVIAYHVYFLSKKLTNKDRLEHN